MKLILKKYSKSTFLVLGAVLLAFLLNFFGEILNGIFKIAFTDELGILSIVSLGVLVCFASKRFIVYQKEFIFLFCLLSLIYLFFYFETLVSFLYEYYKLMIFAVFIPVFRYFNKKNIFDLYKMLQSLFFTVLTVNLVFIALQYITNNQILEIIGYNELRVSGWEKVGRYTGLFDVGTLGATALLMLLFNELFVTKKDNQYYIFTIIAILSVIFSSSKTCYIIFLLWLVIYFKKVLFKHLLKIVIAITVFLSVIFFYTRDAIFSKINQYSYFFDNFEYARKINLGVVEMRAMFWAQAIKIIKENPFGLGLGTFGDASAKYNVNAYRMPSNMWPERYEYLSDSSLSHILAEQGIICILYFLLILTPLYYVHKERKKFVYMLMAFYFIQIPFTMGFSAGTWPLLFALIYAIFYYDKKLNNDTSTSV